MCKSRNSARIVVAAYSGEVRTDKCMKPLIDFLWHKDIDTRACCCGHGKYPMTIVVWDGACSYFEIISGIQIPRGKRFYRKDKEGFYYIPEVMDALSEKKVIKDKDSASIIRRKGR